MTNGGRALDYFHGKPVAHPSLPTILLPTTSGTGSEVNRCFVVTDEETGFKDGVADDLMCPAVTILDPELCLTMPPKVTASSGASMRSRMRWRHICPVTHTRSPTR